MFDFQRQVRLKQAQNAFHDGRIDEAFVIAAEKEIRDLRGGQVLLEDLVNPLLDRATEHFSGGRLKEASLDVERAIQAGGHRPRAAELRQQIRDAMDLREREGRRERDRIESAKAHLRNGSLRTGLEVLESAPVSDEEAEKLRREAESRERRGEEARIRSRAQLEQGDLLEALATAKEAGAAAPRHADLHDLRTRLKKASVAEIERSLQSGSLKAAADLLVALESAAGESLETRRLSGVLSIAGEAARAFQSRDFDAARIAMARLEKELSGAAWVEEGLREIVRVVEGLTVLRTGPFGKPVLRNARDRSADASPATTTPGEAPLHERHIPMQPGSPQGRLLLWVDGVGTYLVLTADRVSLGRTGSSTRPDIALAADISGYHAEIIRAEEDYFVVAAQGQVDVGRQRVERKLLENGDTIALGTSCKLTFELPTPLSPTAVLTLHKGQRIEGDVRKILLLKNHLLIGAEASCHVQGPRKGGVVLLSASPEGLVCRAEDEILLDGRPAGREIAVPLGVHVQIGELTFTITSSVRNNLG